MSAVLDAPRPVGGAEASNELWLLRARSLTYRYAGADRFALAPLDLELRPGEIVGLLGPNGSGKSTLLSLLATSRRPSAGTLELFGRSAQPATADQRRAIGYAGERAVHLEALSGVANVRLFARAAGATKAEAGRAAADLLRTLGLADHAARPAARYSAGMRRKLLLACALAHHPRLLLLDEPFGGLDRSGAAALRSLLRTRAEAGAAVVLSTHALRAAASLCHRVLLLARGVVVAAGAPTMLIRALGAGAILDARIAASEAPRLEGFDVLCATRRRVRVRAPSGATALAPLCAALVASGARVHAVRVREPDLRDVYRAATEAPA